MKKRFHSAIALLLAIVMVLTNVNYVHATDTVDDTRKLLSPEELLAQEIEDIKLLNTQTSFNTIKSIDNSSNDGNDKGTNDGNDCGTNDGNDLGTNDGVDVPTGENILYSGKLHGIVWYIDKDGVLTITGTNTKEYTEITEEDTIETVAPWLAYMDEYTKVVIDAKNVKTTSMWFMLNDIVEVDMSNFDTSTVEDMSYMFFLCTELETLNVSNWNTSKVKDMTYTFGGCRSLTSIDLSNWDTSALESMSCLFVSCYGLTSLDLSKLNTSSVQKMSSVFYGCRNLTSLKLGNIDTSKVTDMSAIFAYCSSLTELDVSKLNTQNVELAAYMFTNCSALTTLDVSNFDTSNIVDAYGMFYYCSNLTSLDVSGFDTSKMTDTTYMFRGCTALESITTFRNLQITIDLPVSPMYDAAGNIYEDIFPLGLTDSVTLLKTSPLEGKMWVTEVAPQTYTGKAIKPAVKVYDGHTLLTEKVDYTISYKNNTKVNDASDAKTAPTIIVKGKGNYTGQETVTFKILPVNLNDENVVAKDIYTLVSTKEQKPVPTITYKGKKLKNNTDFTVSYPSNSEDAYKAAGTYTIKVTGTGNYTGERDIAFTITDGTLISKVKVAAIPKQNWTGSAIEPELNVTYKGSPLVKDTDYTVTYSNHINPGKATATITGIGNYAGTKDVTFQIVGESIAKASVTGIVDKVYTGAAHTQDIVVSVNGTTLSENDYDVTYDKNINAGTARIIITGKGKYSGTIKKTFKIAPYNIATDELDLITGIYYISINYYVKGGVTPEVTPTFNGVNMVSKKDFTVSYSNNKSVIKNGKCGYITIKGKGNFTGTYKTRLYIFTRSISSNNSLTVDVPDVAYSPKAGKFASKPVLYDTNGKKLSAGTDYDKNFVYTLEDGTVLDPKKDTPAVGTVINVTITFKGNYDGTLVTSYKITEASFNSAQISVNPQVYTGKAITLGADDITVTMNGVELKYGEDYQIADGTYTNNVKKGTATVTVKGLGNYGGSKTAKFKITGKTFKWFWNLF